MSGTTRLLVPPDPVSYQETKILVVLLIVYKGSPTKYSCKKKVKYESIQAFRDNAQGPRNTETSEMTLEK